MKYILIFSFLFISCSPSQRLARLIKKNPELVVKDTIFRQDTTIIKEIELDTVFIMSSKTDTFIITKDKLQIKIIHHFDTLKIESVVGADTIIKTITEYVSTVQPPKPFSFFDKAWLFLGKAFSFLLLLLLIYVLLKFAFKVNLP